MPKFQDIICPQSDDLTHLSCVLRALKYSHDITTRLTNRQEGEYCIASIDLTIFDQWCRRHKDYPHSLQYNNKQLVVNIKYPHHNQFTNIIIIYIKKKANDIYERRKAIRDMVSLRIEYIYHYLNNTHDSWLNWLMTFEKMRILDYTTMIQMNSLQSFLRLWLK